LCNYHLHRSKQAFFNPPLQVNSYQIKTDGNAYKNGGLRVLSTVSLGMMLLVGKYLLEGFEKVSKEFKNNLKFSDLLRCRNF
jgi:hypothetical protein